MTMTMTMNKRWIYWFSLLISSVVVAINLVVLLQSEQEEYFLVHPSVSSSSSSSSASSALSSPNKSTTNRNMMLSQRLKEDFKMMDVPAAYVSPATQQQQQQATKKEDPRVSFAGYKKRNIPASGAAAAAASSSISMIHQQQHQQQQQQHHDDFRRSRTLIGIMSADTRNDSAYRKRHRELFTQIWNDTRVCSLAELQRRPETERKHCQLVYTFVIGAATAASSAAAASPATDKNEIINNATTTTKTTTTTQIVDASVPLYRSTPLKSKFSDVNDDDVTLLNIKENMNDGKSPTFFYFASTILEEYNLDYAMKMDGDSILHLHDWFLFAHHHLPPRPYNRGFLGGALRHKAFWPTTPPPNPHQEDTIRLVEQYWKEEYDGMHLYLAGQCYWMSLDLTKIVAEQAPNAKEYLEGHEDHDVSSMAFYGSSSRNNNAGVAQNIHLLTIGKSQRFWEHPVKGQPRWERIRRRELARMAGEVFEDKQLRLYLDE